MTEVYTVKEVAEILKISQATVRKLIHDGEIPMVMIGTQWRIPKEQLLEYMRDNQWTGQTSDTSESTSETQGLG